MPLYSIEGLYLNLEDKQNLLHEWFNQAWCRREDLNLHEHMLTTPSR